MDKGAFDLAVATTGDIKFAGGGARIADRVVDLPDFDAADGVPTGGIRPALPRRWGGDVEMFHWKNPC